MRPDGRTRARYQEAVTARQPLWKAPSSVRPTGGVGVVWRPEPGRGRVGRSGSRVNSQRAREQRIDERLQRGALRLARPLDTVGPLSTGDVSCHGCLDPGADARVGEDPWHSLCVLYWQGRSEVLRSERIPHTPPGPGISPARPRWVIVAPIGRVDTYAALRRRFGRSPWVNVVMDRRQQQEAAPVERRTVQRRTAANLVSEPSGFRFAHEVDGCAVYESRAPESGRCPDCGILVSVELPRFAEPPDRLELVVRHEVVPGGARHVGELQSLSPTGRVLLATRLAGRTRPG
jgi:hypothetical protein